MTPQSYEAAILAHTAYRLSLSDNVDELSAVACTIRNHVIVRPGQRATYTSFPEACYEFLRIYPSRPEPKEMEDCLYAPQGLLSFVDQIWEGTYPDVTATQTTLGATMFARVIGLEEKDWRYNLVKTSTLIGTFGAQQFFRV